MAKWRRPLNDIIPDNSKNILHFIRFMQTYIKWLRDIWVIIWRTMTESHINIFHWNVFDHSSYITVPINMESARSIDIMIYMIQDFVLWIYYNEYRTWDALWYKEMWVILWITLQSVEIQVHKIEEKITDMMNIIYSEWYGCVATKWRWISKMIRSMWSSLYQ